jgi:8-amino-3,8-dideoxy-alpha-D-manno-octulosonate transaminase
MPGFELIGKKEQTAVNDVFEKSGGVLFAHGFDARRNNIFRVRDFETKFAQKLQGRRAAACTSGTAAQYIAMKSLGITAGDEVITQSFTFIATIEAIMACGAKPIIVDINETYNMSPQSLEAAITEKTKLIIPVHMLGNLAEMDEINKIAKRYKIPVLEDACEALGATYKGKSAGLLSDVGVFSLDFGKTITTGEGGMVISNNEDLISKCFKFIDHGHDSDLSLPRGQDTAVAYGFNYRMMELQAAVGLVQIDRLSHIVESNRRHKKIIKDELSAFSDKIKFRKITDEGELADTIIFNLESSKLSDKLVIKLGEEGLGTKNVPDAMRWHFTKYFTQIWENTNYYQNNSTAWSISDKLLSRSVSLPIMVNWTESDLNRITNSLKKILSSI